MDCFDLESGWSKVPSLFVDHPDGISDKQIEATLDKLGFQLFDILGDDDGPKISIHRHPGGRYFLQYDNALSFEWLIAADLPSMLELVHKFEPLIRTSYVERLLKIATDIQELITFPEGGPLACANINRATQRRREREREQSIQKKNASTGQ